MNGACSPGDLIVTYRETMTNNKRNPTYETSNDD